MKPSQFKLIALISGALLCSVTVISIFLPIIRAFRSTPQLALALGVSAACIWYGREWLKNSRARKVFKGILYSPPLFFLASVVIYLFVPIQPVGWLMARYDVSRGVYKVGIPSSPWRKTLSKTLKDRYGITATGSMGCFVTVSQMTYRAGYYSVVHAALMEKYGRDVVKETLAEARAEWEKEYEAKKQTTNQH